MSKKQNSISLSTTKAEYIATGSYCTQLLWMQTSLIMVFVKNILPFIVTIPVPLTSLKIPFNILEQNI